MAILWSRHYCAYSTRVEIKQKAPLDETALLTLWLTPTWGDGKAMVRFPTLSMVCFLFGRHTASQVYAHQLVITRGLGRRINRQMAWILWSEWVHVITMHLSKLIEYIPSTVNSVIIYGLNNNTSIFDHQF